MSPPFRGAGKRALVLSLPERALRAAKGDKPGRRVLRFLAGTGLLLGMQTAIACMGVRAYGRRPLGAADLLTALRACRAALLPGFGLAGERPHGRAGALPVVLVATGVVSDWQAVGPGVGLGTHAGRRIGSHREWRAPAGLARRSCRPLRAAAGGCPTRQLRHRGSGEPLVGASGRGSPDGRSDAGAYAHRPRPVEGVAASGGPGRGSRAAMHTPRPARQGRGPLARRGPLGTRCCRRGNYTPALRPKKSK